METPLISIIIPVYNVEEYLGECLESVINQTYKNLEIWLVDDGSTDSSGDICDKYAEKDMRIEVIHKENGGLSSARNIALDRMKGSYIFFQDSDDYIAKDTIETYVDYMSKYNVDIVMGTYYTFWGKVNGNNCERSTYEVKCFSKLNALRKMLMNEELEHGASGPLFKAELYENIRFPIGKLYEDFATTYYVVANSSKVAFCDDKRGYYRMRPGSIMNSRVSEKNMVLLDIADQVVNDMIEMFPELEVPALRKRIVTYMNVYNDILMTGFDSFSDVQKRIEIVVKENADKFLNANVIKRKEKYKLRMFLLGKVPFYISCWIRFLIHRIKQLKA